MPVMFLLNPPKKGRNGRLPKLLYPRKLGRSAKPRPRASRTMGGRRISKAMSDTMNLKPGQRPVKHRITFYRKPGKGKGKTLYRSIYAAIRNPKKKRRGVTVKMARRKRRIKKTRKARRNSWRGARKAHRRAARKGWSRKRRVRSNPRKRSRRVRAIVLANPRKRRSIRKYRRNFALANPLKGLRLKAAIGPLTQATGLFGGYVATRYVSSLVYEKGLSKIGALNNPALAKWVAPVTNAAVAFGLSFVARKFVFRHKPQIANYILIGGLFAAVKTVIGNLALGKLGARADAAMSGYTDEPLAQDYTFEPVESSMGDDLGVEAEVDRYDPLY